MQDTPLLSTPERQGPTSPPVSPPTIFVVVNRDEHAHDFNPDIAEAINARFNPPAHFLPCYGAYLVKRDAIPPLFAVMIANSPFYMNPIDMINQDIINPLTGLYHSGISSGDNGPYIFLGFSIASRYIFFWPQKFY
ncbi:hypothetical protein BX600DRAFT_531543 [Xylariales sp. PMI_506]|nr:hypothetical protein BX600DRAFT_531543 [Xylariales sp. PMI_506]